MPSVRRTKLNWVHYAAGAWVWWPLFLVAGLLFGAIAWFGEDRRGEVSGAR